jgi:hypothetical protein
MEWCGATTTGMDAMNFHRYYDIPKNIPTLVTLVKISHLRIASIFMGSIWSSPPPIT